MKIIKKCIAIAPFAGGLCGFLKANPPSTSLAAGHALKRVIQRVATKSDTSQRKLSRCAYGSARSARKSMLAARRAASFVAQTAALHFKKKQASAYCRGLGLASCAAVFQWQKSQIDDGHGKYCSKQCARDAGAFAHITSAENLAKATMARRKSVEKNGTKHKRGRKARCGLVVGCFR